MYPHFLSFLTEDMHRIEARPYKLIGSIQNYQWGTKNEKAFIPNFLNMEPEIDLPYAEYWIGTHPKAPSKILIDGEEISLSILIENYPEEILGKRVSEKFNNKLPFLLKILSINQALSIQAHPDKKLAEELNTRDPENYPDDNHKPEIAVAIDRLEAIVGLKGISEIHDLLLKYPEISEVIESELHLRINECKDRENGKLVEDFYSGLMNAKDVDIKKCIGKLLKRIKAKETRSKIEKRFLTEFKNYGYDIGLLSLLTFNHINLKPGEAIFTPAGVPHAYLEGNIIECMANSDNVVRAGLTPKYKDVDTLLKMLEVKSDKTIVNKSKKDDFIIYETPAEEFEIKKLRLCNDIVFKDNEICIMLILEGGVRIEWDDSAVDYSRGDVILIPAQLEKYKLCCRNDSSVYLINVP